MLAEGEVAGAGIQNQIDAVAGELAAGPIGHPGVFADLEADAHAAEIENQVAQRIALAADDASATRTPSGQGLNQRGS